MPDPLPPAMSLGLPIVRRLALAESALGELRGATGKLNPYLIGTPLLHREAILSSRIEGTHTTAEELVLFEAGVPRSPADAHRLEDTQEVANYVRAMRFAIRRMRTLPMSLRLIRETHAQLLKGVRGDAETPGEFRRNQNMIGSRDIHAARFVPPPPREMKECLESLETYLHVETDEAGTLPLLVRLGLIHYQFEAIHPFRDGNGRIGRLLIPVLLCRHERLAEPVLYMSSYLERNRQKYMDLMLRVSEAGDWAAWIEFFLEGVTESAREAIQQTAGLVKLRDRYHDRVREARSSALLDKLVDHLFKTSWTTIRETQELLGVTAASASSNLRRLVQLGIVREQTGRKRGMVFMAHEIVGFMGGGEGKARVRRRHS